MTFSVGERVFAKVKGYSYWPAIIQKIINNSTKATKYEVLFFGSNDIAVVNENSIYLYEENKEKYGKLKINNFKNKIFNTAIIEAETYSNKSCSNLELKNLSSSKSDPEFNKILSGSPPQPENQQLREVHNKVQNYQEQNIDDLETSLTLAAEAGTALLTENKALKEENQRLNLLLHSKEAQVEEYSREEETFIAKIENLQQKISDMERQLSKEKLHRIDMQQIFEDHDINQAQVLNEYEQKIKDQDKEILSLRSLLKTQSSYFQETHSVETGTQTDPQPFSITKSTTLEAELTQLKKTYSTLEENFNHIKSNILYCTENQRKQKKKEILNQSYNSLKTNKRNRHLKNKFSISLQVQKMKEQTIFNEGSHNKTDRLPTYNKQKKLSASPLSDEEDFEVIEVEAMVHSENNCPISNESHNQRTTKQYNMPPCTAKLKKPNETYEDFYNKYIEYYKSKRGLTKTEVHPLTPHITTSTGNVSEITSEEDSSKSNTENNINRPFLDPPHRKTEKFKYKTRIIRKQHHYYNNQGG